MHSVNFEGVNLTLTAPQGMEEHVISLYAMKYQAGGTPIIMTHWTLDAKELDTLIKTRRIVIEFMGVTVQPMRMFVLPEQSADPIPDEVTALRIELQQAQAINEKLRQYSNGLVEVFAAIEKAFEPVKDWYDGGGEIDPAPSYAAMIENAVKDLVTDREESIEFNLMLSRMRNQMPPNWQPGYVLRLPQDGGHRCAVCKALVLWSNMGDQLQCSQDRMHDWDGRESQSILPEPNTHADIARREGEFKCCAAAPDCEHVRAYDRLLKKPMGPPPGYIFMDEVMECPPNVFGKGLSTTPAPEPARVMCECCGHKLKDGECTMHLCNEYQKAHTPSPEVECKQPIGACDFPNCDCARLKTPAPEPFTPDSFGGTDHEPAANVAPCKKCGSKLTDWQCTNKNCTNSPDYIF